MGISAGRIGAVSGREDGDWRKGDRRIECKGVFTTRPERKCRGTRLRARGMKGKGKTCLALRHVSEPWTRMWGRMIMRPLTEGCN